MKKIMIFLMIVFFASAAFAANVQVSWNANTEPDLDGYKVHYGTLPGQYTTIVDVANMTSAQIELTPAYGTTYYFVVTAYDTSGNESEYSDMASVFVPDAVKPEKPKSILVRILEALQAFFRGIFHNSVAATV